MGADGVLRHLYWGPPLSLEQAAAVPEPAPVTMTQFEGRQHDIEELPVEGGARFGVPAVQVRFADGTRGLELGYAGHTIDGGTLRIRFADRHYPIEVDLHYRVHADSDVIERWTSITSTGDRTAGAGDGPVRRAARRLGLLDGAAPAGLRAEPRDRPLGRGEPARAGRGSPRGETVLTSRRGTTGHHANPWLSIDAGDATEEHGEVLSAALAWSGTWRITVSRTPTDAVSVSGGAGHDGYGFRLAPGREPPDPGLRRPLQRRAGSARRAGPGTRTCSGMCCRTRTSCARSSTTPGRRPASTSTRPGQRALADRGPRRWAWSCS